MTEETTNNKELLALAQTDEGKARAKDGYGQFLAYHRRTAATLSDKAVCHAHEARNRLQTCKQGYWEVQRMLDELADKGEMATWLGCSPRHREGYHAETLGLRVDVLSSQSIDELVEMLKLRMEEWKSVADIQLQEYNQKQDKADSLTESAVEAYGDYIRYVALGEKPRDADGNVKELVGCWRQPIAFGSEDGDA